MHRRDEELPTRTREAGECADHGGGIGHVLEHLHAGDHVEAAGLAYRERFRGSESIVDRELGGMRACHG